MGKSSADCELPPPRRGTYQTCNLKSFLAPAPVPLLVFADDWGRSTRRVASTSSVTCCRTTMSIGSIISAHVRRGASTGPLSGLPLEKAGHWLQTRADPLPPSPYQEISPSTTRACGRGSRATATVASTGGCCCGPLSRWCAASEPPIAVTTLPIVADLIGGLPVRAGSTTAWTISARVARPRPEALGTLEEVGFFSGPIGVFIAVSETLQDPAGGTGAYNSPADARYRRRVLGRAGYAAAAGDARRFGAATHCLWGVTDQAAWTRALVRRLGSELTQGTVLLVILRTTPDPLQGSVCRARGPCRPPLPPSASCRRRWPAKRRRCW